MDWSDLTEEDRLGVAEVIAQQQQSWDEPEAAAKPPDDDELLLFLMQFSMILAVSLTSRVLLQRRSKLR